MRWPDAKRLFGGKRLVIGIAFLPIVLWSALPFFPTHPWVVSGIATAQSFVALTFDDGPSPTYTPQILDILRDHDAKGTFFLVGANVSRHPDVARRIVAEGHQVGNHSQDHSYDLPFLLPNQIKNDYLSAQRAISAATGVTPNAYRAPHGRISPWMAATIRAEGARIIGWDVAGGDWKNPRVDILVKRIVSRVKPGSIVLLHDALDTDAGADRGVLVKALPAIIDQLQAKGFRLVTVDELLKAQDKDSVPAMAPAAAPLS